MKSKMFKRIFGLGLATVMSMSMAVSAFADTTGTVTVTATKYGEEVFTEEVEIADIIKKAGGEGKHLYSTAPYADYDEKGVKDPTVADALIQGYNEAKKTNITPLLDTGYPYTPAVISYNWDLHPEYGNPGVYYIYYDSITTANESYTDNKETGMTTYKGDSWLLSVDDKASSEYASSIELKDGMEISFDYKTQEFSYPTPTKAPTPED